MPDIEIIRELVEMMVANDLIELSVREGDQEINLRRPSPTAAGGATVLPNPGAPAGAFVHASDEGEAAVSEGEATDKTQSVDFVEIRSPMVGTFYEGPDPDSPPYVQVGSHVSPATVVCILEAMKVFSEIKAETTGTIEQIVVKSGQPVEYGQLLFLVRPV